MTSTSTAWSPSPGRHKVSIGSSLVRALKARKGAAPVKKSALPDKDFYSFRYHFKPSSVDSSKPAALQVKKGKELTSVTVEHPSTQPNEVHFFSGTETSAKEWECVLIYDESTGAYTLEKLDSFVILNQHDKRQSTSRPSTSLPEDSHDRTQKQTTPSSQPQRYEEEEDEDESDTPLIQQLPFRPPPPQAEKKRRPPPNNPVQSTSRSQKLTPLATPIKPQPNTPDTASKKSSGKRLTPSFSEAPDEEQFSLNIKPPKRAKPNPPTSQPPEPHSYKLELPGKSSAYTSLPSSASKQKPPPPRPPPAQQSAVNAENESSDEEDWDDVIAETFGTSDNAPNIDISVEDDEAPKDIDIEEFNDLINEMQGTNEQPPVEEDFLTAGLREDDPPSMPAPMSMNAFAAGQEVDFSYEDDYSSSEESEDD